VVHLKLSAKRCYASVSGWLRFLPGTYLVDCYTEASHQLAKERQMKKHDRKWQSPNGLYHVLMLVMMAIRTFFGD